MDGFLILKNYIMKSYYTTALPSWLIDMPRQPSFDLVVGKKSDIARMCHGEYLPVP